ncbi:MAG: hypothetical protein RIF41_19050, partial [Polyangiaceae bacterium]
MAEVSSSSLRRQMREEDPRRWLEWTLAELIEELDESLHPGADDLEEECRRMLEQVEGWPRDMHPPDEAQRMMDRVDVLRRELDAEEVHEGEIVKPNTTYSITDQDAARRRSARPATGDNQLDPTKLSPVPPAKDSAPPRKSFTAARRRDTPPGGSRKVPDEAMPMTRRGFGLPGVSPASPVPRAAPTRRGSATPYLDGAGPSPPPDRSSPPPKRSPAAISSDPGPLRKEPRALAVRAPSEGRIAKPVVEATPQVERVPRRGSLPPLGNYEVGRLIIEHLDQDGPVDPRLVLLSDGRGQAAEAYRALFYRLGASSDARALLVATTSEEEDGSVCAANLALAMALGSDERVLLIETRFSQPRLANLFGYVPSECFGRRLAKHRREPMAPWRIAQLGGTELCVLALDPHQQTPPALDAQAL